MSQLTLGECILQGQEANNSDSNPLAGVHASFTSAIPALDLEWSEWDLAGDRAGVGSCPNHRN